MTPIVNPIFFWLIDAGSNLRITFGIFAIVFLAFGVALNSLNCLTLAILNVRSLGCLL